jgi:hypothetical protein
MVPAILLLLAPAAARAATLEEIAKGLQSHKAVYDIDLIATHSGSQILNISGQMAYEWQKGCDAWLTDHQFKLFYEYADAPGMIISSDFSTYEMMDGKRFDFTSRRSRNGEMYQEIRGRATRGEKGGEVVYSLPETLRFDLRKDSYFPVGHTLRLIDHAHKGDKFFTTELFDGSDEEGPVEINAFIGKVTDPAKGMAKSDKIDASLLKSKAWNVRMAVFPAADQEEKSDYEMSAVFLENGIISDMTIEYDDFSVKQRLISLEKLPAQNCGNPSEVPKKP